MSRCEYEWNFHSRSVDVHLISKRLNGYPIGSETISANLIWRIQHGELHRFESVIVSYELIQPYDYFDGSFARRNMLSSLI